MNKKNDPDNVGGKSFLRRWSGRKTDAAPKTDSNGTGSSVKGSIPEDRQTADAANHPELPELLDLKNLFKRPEVSMLDGLNEYDGDYSHYVNLSDILTHEMKRALARSLSEGNSESEATETSMARDSGLSVQEDESISRREAGPEDDA